MRVLVVRNDKIGDFMLAWPALATLSQSGACEVGVLVPAYTAELARMCPWVDHIIIDPGAQASEGEQASLVQEIRAWQPEAAIALFSNWRNANLLRKAGIPYRLAPATKIAQFLYTDKVVQRRSRSQQPEWLYNQELARVFLNHFDLPVPDVHPPYLVLSREERAQVRARMASALDCPVLEPWVVVHPGSGGSAVNLTPAQYCTLIEEMVQLAPQLQIILSAGPDEVDNALEMVRTLESRGVHAHVLLPDHGLQGLVGALDNADLVIAGSTGPLHIAATLNRPTVGFFPARRSATALRWEPINEPSRHLAIQAPEDLGADSFADLDLPQIARQAVAHWRIQPERARVQV